MPPGLSLGRALRKSMGESHVQGKEENMVVEVIRG